MQAQDTQPKATFRKDYLPPNYFVDTIELDFDLHEDHSLVSATMTLRRRDGAADDVPLILNGQDLETLDVILDDRVLSASQYLQGDETLTITDVPATFTLQTRVRIHPEKNTSLSGLYKSTGSFCTQCEAEGFRRITWFLDRPDVMSTYRVRIEADKQKYPVLLSNGNRLETGDAGGGRHFVRWEDPFKKPAYLFAVVAGDLRCHDGNYRTMSGRDVRLEIWVEPQNIDKCEHALRSLQRAMQWDEETFGLEYDLDLYMIVAVSDFNMGAMENKGLNIFNSKYVLAKPDTATDDEYDAIETVIAHEYFHNWTGNRVTCRDWFQLTLKEGLTVFRDQQFSMDLWSSAVKRIDNVKVLRTSQFAEDSGPMAHPIRPESYVKMDNFYTTTVYVKGSEVVRMYQTLLGRDGFRKGMDLYFERHDGEAVTCDDFRAAMADANGRDLSQFERWYCQAGTPTLRAQGAYDASAKIYTVTLEQEFPKVPNLGDPKPALMPVRMSLLGRDGSLLPFRVGSAPASAVEDSVLELTDAVQSFELHGVGEEPVPSFLHEFSAPVRLELERTRDELAFLAAHDKDAFNRWDAGQELARQIILELTDRVQRREELTLDPRLVEAYRKTLDDPNLDGSMKDLALTLPTERFLIQDMKPWDPQALGTAHDFVSKQIGNELRDHFLAIQGDWEAREYRFEQADVDRRALEKRALHYLALLDDDAAVAIVDRRFHEAQNMTEEWAAFRCLVEVRDTNRREQAIQRFYERWHKDPLVLDKWFQAQSIANLGDDVPRIRKLCTHPDFTISNPNRARSVLAIFSMANLRGFHDASGQGYEFLADKVLELDALNPQIASRLVSAFNHYKRFDATLRDAQLRALERIAAHDGLSKDVGEIVGRALA